MAGDANPSAASLEQLGFETKAWKRSQTQWEPGSSLAFFRTGLVKELFEFEDLKCLIRMRFECNLKLLSNEACSGKKRGLSSAPTEFVNVFVPLFWIPIASLGEAALLGFLWTAALDWIDDDEARGGYSMIYVYEVLIGNIG